MADLNQQANRFFEKKRLDRVLSIIGTTGFRV